MSQTFNGLPFNSSGNPVLRNSFIVILGMIIPSPPSDKEGKTKALHKYCMAQVDTRPSAHRTTCLATATT